MEENCIECKNIKFSYEENINVLKDISFSIKSKETVGLIGANGTGKSTILKLLVGLEEGYDGKITINDLPVNKKNYYEIRKKVGYLFQDSDNQLFMPTVEEDIAFGPYNYGLAEADIEKAVLNALETIEISHLKNRPIHKLSGGEKKLVSIATILSMKPDIILLDEPTVTLDPKNRRRVINIINSLDDTKIIASHDLDMVLETCSRVIFLSNGEIIYDGNTKEALTNKDFLENNGLELPLCIR